MSALTDYVINNNIPQPIKLKIQIVKTCLDRCGRGKDARYMRVWIGEHEVSPMVADAYGLKVSKSKNAYNTVIIHGCGMDMCFALANGIYRHACANGYPNMFDYANYEYVE